MNDVPSLLIVNADDFGATASVNRGVVQAYEHGVVTSCSLMVRREAAAEAAAYARANPGLAVGLHLDLGEWFYRDGEWQPTYERVDAEDAAATGEEIARQVAIFRELVGCDPTHIDSHQHVHNDEPVRSLIEQLSIELGVPVRGAHGVAFCGDFYGQDRKGRSVPELITVEHLVDIVGHLEPGVTELMCHPAVGAVAGSMYSAERAREVAVLCDPRVRAAIDHAGADLLSFADVDRLGRVRPGRPVPWRRLRQEAAARFFVSPEIHPDDPRWQALAALHEPSVAVPAYFTSGAVMAAKLDEVIGTDLEHRPLGLCSVLEVGCGYGWVTRHLRHLIVVTVSSCDPAADAVVFVNDQLGSTAFQSADGTDQLQGGPSYDVVCAWSLPAGVKPDGLGTWLAGLLAMVRDGGILALGIDTTVAPPSLVIGEVFRALGEPVCDFRPAFWAEHQDLYVIHKTGLVGSARQRARPWTVEGDDDPEVVVAGHSHAVNLLDAYREGARPDGLRVAVMRSLHWTFNPRAADRYWEIVADTARGRVAAIQWAGNQHTYFTMLQNVPFQVYDPRAAESDGDLGMWVPQEAVRQWWGALFERLTRLLDQLAGSSRVLVLGTPPPKSAEFVLGHLNTEERYLEQAQRRGMVGVQLTPAPVRLALWRVIQEQLASCAAVAGATFVPVPERAMGPDGLLRPDLCYADITHANWHFGEIMWQEIAAALAPAPTR